MNRWLWRWNRLCTMSAGEIASRLRNAAQARFESFAAGRPAAVPAASNAEGPRWIAVPDRTQIDAAAVCTAADRTLAGRFDVFALRGAELGFPPQWMRDPKTGRVAPLGFGKAIDYRREEIVGEIKYLWEPNRHLELVTLAQAYTLTGDDRYALGARTLLDSWFTQCPYPLGVNWTSSLELAVRLVNWSVGWQLLAKSCIFEGDAGAAFRRRWLDNVYLHQRFIAGHLSRHSSANNHLFGELMGLFVAAVTWQCWAESAAWRKRAQAELESEALKQNAADGVNREQAIWYQHEVADMMLLSGLAGRAAGSDFSASYWGRLQAMLGFIAAVMDVAGHVPMIGDADDAVMVRFSQQRGFNVYRSLLASGAVLFGRADFARLAGAFDDKSRWLLPDTAAARFETLRSGAAGESAEPPARAFREGGYFILGDRLGSSDEIRVVADAGPLGYLSIAAHGHADALAFTLNVAGQEILVDPGTYAYRAGDGWRDYFKGTGAHNTVRVDGEDQSVSAGSFMWLQHARARCEAFESTPEFDRFVGSHDGYRRLSDPVTHRREIVVYKGQRAIDVVDTLECRSEHAIEVTWHFAEDAEVTLDGDSVRVQKGAVRIRISLSGADFTPNCVLGQTAPPLGWVSRRFDVKHPAPIVRWSGQISRSSRWSSHIKVETAT